MSQSLNSFRGSRRMDISLGIRPVDLLDNESLLRKPSIVSTLTEPFSAGRAAPRLLFDFSAMMSLLEPSIGDAPVLDFGAGSGWVSEFCARMGFHVVAFDIHGDLKACLENRVRADSRIDASLLSFSHGNGHEMPFEDGQFGHLLCYDTLHHMEDYPKVFSEFFRVLRKGGRAIFVEPGARHSISPDTIAFVNEQKKHDPTWIERDVVLEEIDQIARDSGFGKGVSVVPMPHPINLDVYSMKEWSSFRNRNLIHRFKMTEKLAKTNYWERVIFFVDKS